MNRPYREPSRASSPTPGQQRPEAPSRVFLGTVLEVEGRTYIYDARRQDILALDDHEDLETVLASLAGPRPRLVPATVPADFDSNLEHLVLTVTDQCNLRCAYCLHGADLDGIRPHGPGQMSREVAARAVDYFLERCAPEKRPAISFYGGEPLLRLDLLEELVDRIRTHPRGREAHLVIDTNGHRLDDAAIGLVVEHGLCLQVSLDGPRQIHDRHRRTTSGEPTFDSIMSNLDRLLWREPEAHRRLNFVCTLAPPVDADAVERFFNAFPLFITHGIKAEPQLRVNLADLHGLNWSASRDERQSLLDWMERKREAFVRAVAAGQYEVLGPFIKSVVEKRLRKLHRRTATVLGKTFSPGANCVPGLEKLHVTVDGMFQPCERVGTGLMIGDVWEGLDREAVEELNQEFFEEVGKGCEGCWALRLCRVCFAGWKGRMRGDGEWGDRVCDGVRRGVEGDLRVLVRVLEMSGGGVGFLEE